MITETGKYLSPKEVKKMKSKGTTQKTIIFGNGEFYEIKALHHQLTQLDVVRGITLHKFMRLLIQEGMKTYSKALRTASKEQK